jgi:hypothetical protein
MIVIIMIIIIDNKKNKYINNICLKRKLQSKLCLYFREHACHWKTERFLLKGKENIRRIIKLSIDSPRYRHLRPNTAIPFTVHYMYIIGLNTVKAISGKGEPYTNEYILRLSIFCGVLWIVKIAFAIFIHALSKWILMDANAEIWNSRIIFIAIIYILKSKEIICKALYSIMQCFIIIIIYSFIYLSIPTKAIIKIFLDFHPFFFFFYWQGSRLILFWYLFHD